MLNMLYSEDVLVRFNISVKMCNYCILVYNQFRVCIPDSDAVCVLCCFVHSGRFQV